MKEQVREYLKLTGNDYHTHRMQTLRDQLLLWTAEPDPQTCPTCGSPKPHLHPACQFEGDCHVCPDRFHLQLTAENTLERISYVNRMVSQLGIPHN